LTHSPPTLLLVGTTALVLLGLAFRQLVSAFRSPTGPERVVALLLGLLVVEASLYPDPNDVPAGLFHPTAGNTSLRLFDVLIPVAVAAWLVAGRRRRPMPLQLLLWGAFSAWLAIAALQGLDAGNSSGLVAFHAKAIIYVGALVLTAQVTPRRWLESRALRRVVVMASALAALLLVTSQAQVHLDLAIPLVRLTGFGALGSDAASIFAILGGATLLIGICSERRRLSLVLLSLPLLSAPLAAGQRAAIVGLGAAAAASVLLMPLARRNIRVTPTEIALGVLAGFGLLALLLTLDTLRSDSHVALPLARDLQDAFGSRGKQLSEQDRLNQWSQARELIAARPWFGWGLGKEYDFYSPGFYSFMRTDLTHNIALDLLLRTGIVGLVFFAAAAVASLRDAAVSWMRNVDARIAALGLACCAGLAGLLVKGMFESLFEKYRLAILIGGLIGVSASLAIESAAARAPSRWPARRERLRLDGQVVSR
jgi:O-antigen ligase